MNNTFWFKTCDIECSIKLPGKVVFIVGDSSTGKTYLAKYLDNLINENSLVNILEYTSNIAVDDILVCLEKTGVPYILEKLRRNKNIKLVILDRFDMYANKELIDLMYTRPNTYFIVMYRGAVRDIKTTISCMLKLEHEKRDKKIIFKTVGAL